MKLAPKAGIRGVVGILLVLTLQVLLSSCDATAILFVDQVKWEELQVLSAVPVKKESGEFVPVCRSTTDEPMGLQFNVLFRGSTKKGDSGERDISIKPLELVDNQTIDPSKVNASLFEWDIDCIDAYPDGDLYACSNAFTGGDNLPVEKVDFYNYNQPGSTNNRDVAVAVLLDMSGSMNGLAIPYYPYNEDPLDIVSNVVFDTTLNATDPKNARYTALENFIKTLNDGDALIVFGYNESGIKVICDLADRGEEDEITKLKKCFGTDRDLITGMAPGATKTALDSFKGTERGRTPLWAAVEFVYGYMRGETDEAKSAKVTDYDLRHILVIGDGPDTCAKSPEQSQCSGGCAAYSTSYETVRDMIDAIPMSERLPIHFVQMAAKGYPDRDPRQQEIACMTGGHYMFVNALDIAGSKLLDVLSRTINSVRYTFRGYWRFEMPLGPAKKANDPERGWLYGLAGGGKVLRGQQGMLVKNESVFGFRVDGDTNADKRVSFRKECDPDGADVCPGSESYNECSSLEWWCDDQTLTCLSAQAWKENGEKSTCKPEDVYVSLETRTKVGDKTMVSNELYKIKSVETRCCRGGCMPPNPPEVPANVAKPEGMASACFWYDEAKGWVHTNPARFDREIVECVAASDCGEDFSCIANSCVMTCVFESDCTDALGAGYTCSQSKCAKSCGGDGDCPGGWVCAAGSCQVKACQAAGDCPTNYTCEDDVCQYDFDNVDDLAWIYFGTLNVKAGCEVENFEDYLSGYGSTDFSTDDWSHCTSSKNCFQPPGFETEAPAGTPEG